MEVFTLNAATRRTGRSNRGINDRLFRLEQDTVTETQKLSRTEANVMTSVVHSDADCKSNFARKPLWILSCSRTGDLNQMVQIAKETGLDYQIKKVDCESHSLSLLRARNSDLYNSQLPQIIMCAERYVTTLAIDLKSMSNIKVKLVAVNRPRTYVSKFDLIITAPHFRVKNGPNVLQFPTPIHTLDSDCMNDIGKKLLSFPGDLPRPYTVVFIGSKSGVERLNSDIAKNIAFNLNARSSHTGGSIILTTSPRTHADVADTFIHHLEKKHKIFIWKKDADFNPYSGLLDVADEFVVTSDSASMVTEALLTGKPVYLYKLPRIFNLKEAFREALFKVGERFALIGWMFDAGVIEARADRRLLFSPLEKCGVLRNFNPKAESWTPPPLNSFVKEAAAAVKSMIA